MALHYRTIMDMFTLLCIYLYLCIFLELASKNGDPKNKLDYVAWNMRSFSSGNAYLRHLMQTNDIIAVSEHGLYECQLWKLTQVQDEFYVTAKACQSLDNENANCLIGHSGVALFWKESICQYVNPVAGIKSDRICAIEVMMPATRNVIVISVYLPHRASTVAKYTDELVILEDLVEKATSNNWGIVMLGDINAHFGCEFGGRGWGTTSHNGHEFSRLVDRNELCIIDITDKAYGPVYTFQSRTRHAGISYIDHCVVSDNVKDSVLKVCVYDDCIMNSSDHLPLGLEICHDRYARDVVRDCNAQLICTRVIWKKWSATQIRDGYTEPLETETERLLHLYNCNGTESCLTNVEILVHFTNDVKAAIVNAAAGLVPSRKKRSHLKPYWTVQLTTLSKHQKLCWKRWVDAGRPRLDDNQLWVEYKTAKRDFRRMQRRAEHEFHLKQIEQLCKHAEMDQKGFWFIVNRARKPREARVHLVKGDNGDVLTDPQAIVEDWRHFYEQSFECAGKGRGYDDIFYDHVVSSVKKMEIESLNRTADITSELITEAEVKGIYKTLKNGKAPGYDGISNEHLKYAGPIATKAITLMLNSMVQLEHVPPCFKKGIICPIPKGGGKDPSKKQNNRPITLLPCLYKVFEKVLLNRFDVWLKSHKVMCELQGACVSRCSSLDVVAMLNETISYHRELGNSVYTVLMDVAKAFDSVWSEGLLYKLFNLGVEGRFWRILKMCFEDFKCNVLVNKMMSGELNVGRGVHQGAPLSMRLYQIYNNDLIKSLSLSGMSVGIVDLKTGAPTFADDVAVISLYKAGMNVLLDIAHKHSVKWRYNFNGAKFQALCFGKDVAPDQAIVFGGQDIALQAGTKHMGVPLCVDQRELKKQIVQRCEQTKKETRVIMSISEVGCPLPPIIGSKVFKSACLPRLMYGLEACSMGTDCLTELQKTHRHCAKIIQGLPIQTPNPVPTATLGWVSVECVLDVYRIIMLYRWLSQPLTTLYKRIAIQRVVQFLYGPVMERSGPIFQAYCTIVKYGLQTHIVNILEGGTSLSLKQFKRLVWESVSEKHQTEWKASLYLYRSLSLYRECSPSIKTCVWWQVSYSRPHLVKATRCVVRMLCGLLRNEGRGVACHLCDAWAHADAVHVLFACDSLAPVRAEFWENVLREMPIPMADYVSTQLNSADKTQFLLSGFNCSYTPEWLNLYAVVAMFVLNLFNKYVHV